LTYPAVDFLNAKPYLGYETNFDKRHGLFWVRWGIHEKSKHQWLNFGLCLFKQV